MEVEELEQCDFIQGYYFSRPLTAEESEKILSEEKTCKIKVRGIEPLTHSLILHCKKAENKKLYLRDSNTAFIASAISFLYYSWNCCLMTFCCRSF